MLLKSAVEHIVMKTCGDTGHKVFQLMCSLGLHPTIDPRARGDSLQASTLATGRLERPPSRPHAALVHESNITMGAPTLSDRCLRPRRHHANFLSLLAALVHESAATTRASALCAHSCSSSVDENVAVPQSLEPGLFWFMSPDFAHHLQVWS